MKKTAADTLIAVIAMATVGGVAKAYFNIGQPLVKPEYLTNAVDKLTSAASRINEAAEQVHDAAAQQIVDSAQQASN